MKKLFTFALIALFSTGALTASEQHLLEMKSLKLPDKGATSVNGPEVRKNLPEQQPYWLAGTSLYNENLEYTPEKCPDFHAMNVEFGDDKATFYNLFDFLRLMPNIL